MASLRDKLYYIPESTAVELKDCGDSVEGLFTTVIIEICCQILLFLLKYDLHPFSVIGLYLRCFWCWVFEARDCEVAKVFLEGILKVASSRIAYNWVMISSLSTKYSIICKLLFSLRGSGISLK